MFLWDPMTTRNKSLTRVAFWLVPGPTERTLLGKEIASFAEQYDSPVFTPHVTLYSCERSEMQHELGLLASLSRYISPFNMSVESLGGSDRLAQTFYLGLDRCDEAEQLHQDLATGLPNTSNYSFEPHLSLIYQSLSESELQKLIDDWCSPLQTICFDQLWAVAIPAQIKTLDDFSGWQPLLVCQLDSSLNIDTL